MKEPLAVSPHAWLMQGPILIRDPTAVLAGFSPAPLPRVHRFRGPHVLYRAGGLDAKGKTASAYGSWWAEESVLISVYQRMGHLEDWLPHDALGDSCNRTWIPSREGPRCSLAVATRSSSRQAEWILRSLHNAVSGG